MTFVQMLNAVIAPHTCGTLSAAAKGIGISPQYLHDLKEGRRLPSVEVVNKICGWLGRGPKGRAEWHMAGAAAHGWETASSADFTTRIAIDDGRDERVYAHRLALQTLENTNRDPDSDLSVLARQSERQREALRAAYEIYAGSEGFIPQTAAEAYQQQIIKQMVTEIEKGLSA